MVLYFGIAGGLVVGIVWLIKMIKDAPIIDDRWDDTVH